MDAKELLNERIQPGSSENLQELYANLECPVCNNYMAPPIPECRNKHSICNHCFQKVESCPLCRAPKHGHGISFHLGEIYDMLTIPCRFRDRGCQYSCKGEFLHNHETDCEYRTRGCPVKRSLECPWEGPISEMKNHMLSKHPSNSCIDKESEMFVLNGFKENRRFGYFTIIFCVYENFFRFTWNIDKAGMTKWAVYYIGERKEAQKFGYEIVFHRRSSSRFSKILIWRSPCTDAPKNDSYIIHSKCFHANINLVDSYCTGVGELCYTVRIFRNNSSRPWSQNVSTIFGCNLNV